MRDKCLKLGRASARLGACDVRRDPARLDPDLTEHPSWRDELTAEVEPRQSGRTPGCQGDAIGVAHFAPLHEELVKGGAVPSGEHEGVHDQGLAVGEYNAVLGEPFNVSVYPNAPGANMVHSPDVQ